jgi:hypothetical protein
MAMLHRRPYRCHNCGLRFYTYRDGEQSPRLRTAEERRIMALRRKIRWKRSKTEMALYLFAVLFLVASIYYLIQQRIEAPPQ